MSAIFYPTKCRSIPVVTMLISTVGNMEQRIAAKKVMVSAIMFAGFVETKAGAITEINTQPGTASRIVCARMLRVRFRSATYPIILVR